MEPQSCQTAVITNSKIIGIARLPASPAGRHHYAKLVSVASEIWSSAPQPVQHAAVVAFTEPPEIRERIEQSRILYARITNAVAQSLRAAGCAVPDPHGGFYLYPGFTAHARHLRDHHAIHTDADLTRLLLRHGVATLPGSAFGDDQVALNLRIATSLLTGDTDHQRETALHSDDPLALPWISQALRTLDQAVSTITACHA